MTRKTELPPPGVRVHEPGVHLEPVSPPPRARTAWAWRVATFFSIGRLKPGPGTWASLAVTLVWYLGLSPAEPTPLAVGIVSLAGAFAATLAGIPASTIVERESGIPDPGFVVIDEVAGQCVTLAVTPVDVGHAFAAFLLFRFFDIVKPWPIRRLERFPGGVGIMLDDLGAGALGLLFMLALRVWW
jgi:phosphatidylglycerophosphatase A